MGNTTELGFNGPEPGQDLVLQNDNGAITIWQLQVVGNQVVRTDTGFDLGNPWAGWHVVGVRDMNADSKADLLLQNDNGVIAVWDNSRHRTEPRLACPVHRAGPAECVCPAVAPARGGTGEKPAN
jgi:hypothetical protein